MLKIVLIALGLHAALAFGTVPSSTDDEVSLTLLSDTGWCAGGADWRVAPVDRATHGFAVDIDFDGEDPKSVCWEACERASELSYAEDIKTVPSREADPHNRQRSWQLLNAKYCPHCPMCYCESRCECVSNELQEGTRDLIKRTDDPMPAAFGPPVEGCCESGYNTQIVYCTKTYDDGSKNLAFPNGRVAGYYESFHASFLCKDPGEMKVPFTPREATENCKARAEPEAFTWSVGKVDYCVPFPISIVVGNNEDPFPVNTPGVFSRLEPDQADEVIPAGEAFYWKIACDSDARTLEAKVYWDNDSCVADDEAGTNSPAGACYGAPGPPPDGCNIFSGTATPYQYGLADESCNATIHGPLGRRAEEETVSFAMNRIFKGYLIEEYLANAK